MRVDDVAQVATKAPQAGESAAPPVARASISAGAAAGDVATLFGGGIDEPDAAADAARLGFPLDQRATVIVDQTAQMGSLAPA